MKKLTLKGTDIVTTSLGFGCAGLMRNTSSRGRQRVLNSAYDAGIMHFDVARMYGMGLAEAEVGRFVKGRRSDVVIATKFGIEVNQGSRMLAPLMNVARLLIKLVPSVRKLAKNNTQSLYKRHYDANTAQACLDKSLLELQTDYVDLFLLHEPTLSDLKNSDVLEFLEKSKENGKIRAYGIAGYPEGCMAICKEMSELTDVLQVPNDVINRQLDQFNEVHSGALITFSPFSNALNEIVTYVRSGQNIRRKWNQATGRDCASYEEVSKLLLKYCTDKNPDGVVLFSTTKSERIGRIADAIDDQNLDHNVINSFSSLVKAGLNESTRL